ncbi:MAG: biopolymer transporter ExbD [Bacteroidota bacterium]
MRFRSNAQPYLTAFSYASLTDIVLQLLIFFLLSSAYVIQSGVKVQLPKAATGERGIKAQVVVSVNAEGSFFLNTRPVSREQLLQGVRGLLQQQTDQVVVIQADKSVSLQLAVEAMDVVKAAGGTKFLIATEPVE